MRKHLPLKILFVGLFLGLAACSVKAEEQLIGRWIEVDASGELSQPGQPIEFFEDGGVNIRNHGTDFTGVFVVLDDERLRVDTTMLGPTVSQVVEFSVEDDLLSLNNEGQSNRTYYIRYGSRQEQTLRERHEARIAAITGRWLELDNSVESAASGMVLDFRADGVLNMLEDQRTTTLTYLILDDVHIRLENGTSSLVWRYSIERNILSMSDDGSETKRFVLEGSGG